MTGLATDVGHLDFGQPRRFLSANLGIAIIARLPHRCDLVADLVVARAAAQERLEVVARLREKAGEERALGGEPHPGAARAEGLRDRGDDADLARAVH